MSIITDSHAIGVDTRNLVLKTRGTLHVKVGEQYYEIDFKNLKSEKVTIEEKDDYILSINSKEDLEQLEYPGDNKLVIGLDKSLFITKDGFYIDVTPESKAQTISLKEVDDLTINNSLRGNGSLYLDFNTNDIVADKITIVKEAILPASMIKNRCCQTYKKTYAGVEYIATDYSDMDFIELTMVPDELIVKSGVLIKSQIDARIPVIISGFKDTSEFEFKSGKLYIIYNNYEKIIQTVLN